MTQEAQLRTAQRASKRGGPAQAQGWLSAAGQLQDRLQAGGGWWLVAGGWWLVAGGWWLGGCAACCCRWLLAGGLWVVDMVYG
jgi:hypothetical protein